MNLPQLNNLIHYVTLMCYANFLCFMIHVSYINIALSLFICFMLAYSKEVDTGKNCVPESTIIVRDSDLYMYCVLYDPNGVAVMTQTRLTIFVCCSNCIPNRHAHLSIYLVITRQLVLLHFQYISHIHE